ncbi:hypothetical protein [Roseivirga echinicomitans]|uniref:Uncharacterized protein n=1 Tax=Roseivirga echinicomitans TaxID=296218 RepID=A0A150XLI9_9BACT|nr:hypothetical protein [Roseivirga echinicomitans]KYG79609.1 hypothetical protein AWN68_17535 [Roseivirga echinicomitans]
MIGRINSKQEKKIREIIDRSLSDSDKFTVQFDNNALSIESDKQSIIHHIMFIAFIIVPVLAILWYDRSFYSIAVSALYFSALSYSYFNILKYEVSVVFKLKERVLTCNNRVVEKFGGKIKTISFENLDSVEFSYVTYARWFAKRYVRVYFRTASESIPIIEIRDEFKARRLKFILTEIVK